MDKPDPGDGPCPFVVRTLVIEPGQLQPFLEAEWLDAFVIVDQGEIELECHYGSRHRFYRGNLLWLVGLRLTTLHNPGDIPATLIAISRRTSTDPISTDLGYAPRPGFYCEGYL